eukprot:jgi/Ulvmu1/2374/UM130_0007.1
MVVSGLKPPTAGSLRQLLQDKEREFTALAQHSFQTLEQQLEEKSHDYEVLQERFKHLKDDFLYNEGVLQERDDEIECLEGQLKELRASHTIVTQKLKESELRASSTQSELLIEKDRSNSLQQDLTAARTSAADDADAAERRMHEALLRQREDSAAELSAAHSAAATAAAEAAAALRHASAEADAQRRSAAAADARAASAAADATAAGERATAADAAAADAGREVARLLWEAEAAGQRMQALEDECAQSMRVVQAEARSAQEAAQAAVAEAEAETAAARHERDTAKRRAIEATLQAEVAAGTAASAVSAREAAELDRRHAAARALELERKLKAAAAAADAADGRANAATTAAAEAAEAAAHERQEHQQALCAVGGERDAAREEVAALQERLRDMEAGLATERAQHAAAQRELEERVAAEVDRAAEAEVRAQNDVEAAREAQNAAQEAQHAEKGRIASLQVDLAALQALHAGTTGEGEEGMRARRCGAGRAAVQAAPHSTDGPGAAGDAAVARARSGGRLEMNSAQGSRPHSDRTPGQAVRMEHARQADHGAAVTAPTTCKTQAGSAMRRRPARRGAVHVAAVSADPAMTPGAPSASVVEAGFAARSSADSHDSMRVGPPSSAHASLDTGVAARPMARCGERMRSSGNDARVSQCTPATSDSPSGSCSLPPSPASTPSPSVADAAMHERKCADPAGGPTPARAAAAAGAAAGDGVRRSASHGSQHVGAELHSVLVATQAQNAQLRHTLAGMRREMEAVKSQRGPADAEGHAAGAAADAVTPAARAVGEGRHGAVMCCMADAAVQVDCSDGSRAAAGPVSCVLGEEDRRTPEADGGDGRGVRGKVAGDEVVGESGSAAGLACVRAELAGETGARTAAEAQVARLQVENERLMDVSGELRAQWEALTAQLPPAFVEAALRGGGGGVGGAAEWRCGGTGAFAGWDGLAQVGCAPVAEVATWDAATGCERGGGWSMPAQHAQHAQQGDPCIQQLTSPVCAGFGGAATAAEAHAVAAGERAPAEGTADVAPASAAAAAEPKATGGVAGGLLGVPHMAGTSDAVASSGTDQAGAVVAGSGGHRRSAPGAATGAAEVERGAGCGRGAAAAQSWGGGGGGRAVLRRPASNSERATASQRARLQSLSRRRDTAAVGEAGYGAGHVPSILARNWNIKDDMKDGGADE